MLGLWRKYYLIFLNGFGSKEEAADRNTIQVFWTGLGNRKKSQSTMQKRICDPLALTPLPCDLRMPKQCRQDQWADLQLHCCYCEPQKGKIHTPLHEAGWKLVSPSVLTGIQWCASLERSLFLVGAVVLGRRKTGGWILRWQNSAQLHLLQWSQADFHQLRIRPREQHGLDVTQGRR